MLRVVIPSTRSCIASDVPESMSSIKSSNHSSRLARSFVSPTSGAGIAMAAICAVTSSTRCRRWRRKISTSSLTSRSRVEGAVGAWPRYTREHVSPCALVGGEGAVVLAGHLAVDQAGATGPAAAHPARVVEVDVAGFGDVEQCGAPVSALVLARAHEGHAE